MLKFVKSDATRSRSKTRRGQPRSGKHAQMMAKVSACDVIVLVIVRRAATRAQLKLERADYERGHSLDYANDASRLMTSDRCCVERGDVTTDDYVISTRRRCAPVGGIEGVGGVSSCDRVSVDTPRFLLHHLFFIRFTFCLLSFEIEPQCESSAAACVIVVSAAAPLATPVDCWEYRASTTCAIVQGVARCASE